MYDKFVTIPGHFIPDANKMGEVKLKVDLVKKTIYGSYDANGYTLGFYLEVTETNDPITKITILCRTPVGDPKEVINSYIDKLVPFSESKELDEVDRESKLKEAANTGSFSIAYQGSKVCLDSIKEYCEDIREHEYIFIIPDYFYHDGSDTRLSFKLSPYLCNQIKDKGIEILEYYKAAGHEGVNFVFDQTRSLLESENTLPSWYDDYVYGDVATIQHEGINVPVRIVWHENEDTIEPSIYELFDFYVFIKSLY